MRVNLYQWISRHHFPFVSQIYLPLHFMPHLFISSSSKKLSRSHKTKLRNSQNHYIPHPKRNYSCPLGTFLLFRAFSSCRRFHFFSNNLFFFNGGYLWSMYIKANHRGVMRKSPPKQQSNLDNVTKSQLTPSYQHNFTPSFFFNSRKMVRKGTSLIEFTLPWERKPNR